MKYIVSLAGREVEVDVDGAKVTITGDTHDVHLADLAGTPLRQLTVDGETILIGLRDAGRGRWQVDYRGGSVEAEVMDERTRHIRSLVGAGKAEARGGTLKAPMPGLVVRILVEEGAPVAAGAGVVVLEAMKMENELKAPADGRVSRVLVRAGQAVEKGAALVEFEGGSSPA